MKIAEVSRNRPSLSLSPVSPVNYIVMKSAIFDRRSFHRGLPLIKFPSFSISPRRYSLRHRIDELNQGRILLTSYLNLIPPLSVPATNLDISFPPPPLIIEPDYLDRMLPIRHCQFNRVSMGGTNEKRFSIRSNSSFEYRFETFHHDNTSVKNNSKLYNTIKNRLFAIMLSHKLFKIIHV